MDMLFRIFRSPVTQINVETLGLFSCGIITIISQPQSYIPSCSPAKVIMGVWALGGETFAVTVRNDGFLVCSIFYDRFRYTKLQPT